LLVGPGAVVLARYLFPAVVQAAYIPREIFRVHRFRCANTHFTRTMRQEAAKTMDSILTGS
jgi:hypothetical protein